MIFEEPSQLCADLEEESSAALIAQWPPAILAMRKIIARLVEIGAVDDPGDLDDNWDDDLADTFFICKAEIRAAIAVMDVGDFVDAAYEQARAVAFARMAVEQE